MGFLDELRVDQEVAHTRLLAWLLKPDGDHELQSLVLSAFWRRIGLSKSRKGLRSATVRIEQRHEKTIPDIVITTQGVYVLIENKIRWPAFNQQQIEGHAKSGKRRAGKKSSSLCCYYRMTPTKSMTITIAQLFVKYGAISTHKS